MSGGSALKAYLVDFIVCNFVCGFGTAVLTVKSSRRCSDVRT